MTPGLRLDLHVHSASSPDGRSSVDELVAQLERLGLDGLALTDHNSVAGHARLKELARERPRLRLLPGVEISSREGHLLAYGLDVVPPAGRPVEETIDWVTAHGGVPVLAHPYRRTHGVGEGLARRLAVPSVEVVNGHNGRRANAHARTLASVRSLGLTGGSDAHDAGGLGRAWTLFPDGASSVDELLEALRRGSTSAEGRAAGPLERSRIALRSFALRLRRGLRPL